MTIHHTKVHAQITAASTILSDLVTRLPRAVHSANLAIIDPVQSDRPRAEDAGVRSKGDHTDPTADTALGRAVRGEHILGDLGDQLSSLALTLSLLVTFADRWNAVDVVATRCSGGRTIDDWSRPDCGNNVEADRGNDGTYRERGHGLCATCRRRRDDWNRDNGEAAA